MLGRPGPWRISRGPEKAATGNIMSVTHQSAEGGQPVDPHAARPQYTVLIMAANRLGIENPIAKMAGVSHKCVAPLLGKAMIERVVGVIEDWGRARRILISIERPEVLDDLPYISELRQSGKLQVVLSGPTLADSVYLAAKDLADEDFPLFITTGDNVLHTVEIVEAFTRGAEEGGDVALGLTPRTVVEKAYPEDAPGVGYLALADGEHSNCNVYVLSNRDALPIAEMMRTGGQFRSNPKRIIKAFGLFPLIMYKLGWAKIAYIRKHVKRALGISLNIVIMPFADAPIDADTPKSFALAERILKARD